MFVMYDSVFSRGLSRRLSPAPVGHGRREEDAGERGACAVPVPGGTARSEARRITEIEANENQIHPFLF